MVLEDVTEYEITPEGKQVGSWGIAERLSLWKWHAGQGGPFPHSPPVIFVLPQETHLNQILLNGNNIALLVPGGKPEGTV